MSKQTINIGASPNDGTGTPLRTSFDYTNQNFTELYTALGGGVGLPGATTQVIFNDGGTNLAGDAGLVYNKTTDTLTAGNATITGALTVDTTTLVVDATNDRVGIRTASPADILEVVGSGSTGIRVSRSGALTQYATLSAGATGPTLDASSALSSLSFGIAGTTGLTLNSTANLVLKGGTAGANGVGLTFPATQVASSDANCLDDYEEGTFTPTIAGLTTTGVGVYGLQSGKYTKVGNLVTFQVFLTWTAHTGTGNMIISGLPFTSGANFWSGTVGFANNISLTAGKIMVGYIEANAAYVNLQQYATGGGATAGIPIDTAGEIMFSGSYTV